VAGGLVAVPGGFVAVEPVPGAAVEPAPDPAPDPAVDPAAEPAVEPDAELDVAAVAIAAPPPAAAAVTASAVSTGLILCRNMLHPPYFRIDRSHDPAALSDLCRRK